MEEQRETSIRVRRISAEPVGTGTWPSWERALAEAPWLGRAHLDELRSLHPEACATQLTTLRKNHGQWGSMSDYLEEVALDSDAANVLDGMRDGEVTYGDLTPLLALEIRESTRETTLFHWSRPLVHIATHIVVDSDDLDDARVQRIIQGLPASVPTMRSDNLLGLLAAGAPKHIETTIHTALRPHDLPPPPWKTRSCRLRTESLLRGKEND